MLMKFLELLGQKSESSPLTLLKAPFPNVHLFGFLFLYFRRYYIFIQQLKKLFLDINYMKIWK